MKVVSPYRPFEPESPAHRKLGAFDWLGAFDMLRASVQRTNDCEAYLLTDMNFIARGVPTLQVSTRSLRLMPWILEVALRYIESDLFMEDTVFVSPDTLVLKDLRFGFLADLGLIVRTKEKFAQRKPLLNSVQWWKVSAKERLAAFYREALRIAGTLEEGDLRWGGDTVPLVRLLAPLTVGSFDRGGLSCYGWARATTMATVSSGDLMRLSEGKGPMPTPCPLVDFKYLRKLAMRDYFERLPC